MVDATESRSRQRVPGWWRVPGLGALAKLMRTWVSERHAGSGATPAARGRFMIPVRYESGDRGWVQVRRIAEIRESWTASGVRQSEVVLRDPRERAESTAVVERYPEELAAELNGN
ncbi:MAG: hypothetical protein K8T90_15605 [Planctomycetes bacterium]|nr:hypothetical protein [Planctomycetota bacterium]